MSIDTLLKPLSRADFYLFLAAGLAVGQVFVWGLRAAARWHDVPARRGIEGPARAFWLVGFASMGYWSALGEEIPSLETWLELWDQVQRSAFTVWGLVLVACVPFYLRAVRMAPPGRQLLTLTPVRNRRSEWIVTIALAWLALQTGLSAGSGPGVAISVLGFGMLVVTRRKALATGVMITTEGLARPAAGFIRWVDIQSFELRTAPSGSCVLHLEHEADRWMAWAPAFVRRHDSIRVSPGDRDSLEAVLRKQVPLAAGESGLTSS